MKLTPLEQWYTSLPANKQVETRNLIMVECDIKAKSAFYRYLKSGREDVPKLVREKIAELINKKEIKLFPKKQKKQTA